MSKQVIWSPLAENDLEQILDYLHKNWNRKVVIEFLELIENMVFQIGQNPKQFPLIHKTKIRRCILTRHNTLFYRYNKNTIAILRIFDNRQNPDKLNFA